MILKMQIFNVQDNKPMKSKYVERFRYGIHVTKAKGETISGEYYTFVDGSIGGKHNYRKITRLRYALLSMKYYLLKTLFSRYFQKIESETWNN